MVRRRTRPSGGDAEVEGDAAGEAHRARFQLVCHQLQLAKLVMDACSALPTALAADDLVPQWWDPAAGLASAVLSVVRLFLLSNDGMA